MRTHWIWIVCLSGLLLTACDGERGGDAPGGGKPVIAATIFPLADITRQIVGEYAEVVCLVPPGASPHGYEPNADQMAVLGKAKMLVMVGGGFDHWARRAAKAAGNENIKILQFVSEECQACVHGHEHEHDGHHDHGAIDPHVWLDQFSSDVSISKLIARELVSMMPSRKEEIGNNHKLFHDEFVALQKTYQSKLNSVKTRKLVTYHGAFNRLAEYFDLEVVATLMPVEGPGAMTSGRLDAAIKAVREHNLKVIFTEPQFPPDAAEALAKQTGVKVMMLDPIGDPNVPERSTYLKMMRYNLQTLVEGLNL